MLGVYLVLDETTRPAQHRNMPTIAPIIPPISPYMVPCESPSLSGAPPHKPSFSLQRFSSHVSIKEEGRERKVPIVILIMGLH